MGILDAMCHFWLYGEDMVVVITAPPWKISGWLEIR